VSSFHFVSDTPDHVNAVDLCGLQRSGHILFRVARLRDQGIEERILWTLEEDCILAKAHAELGDQWYEISKRIERWDAKAVESRWNNTRFERIEQGLSIERKTWTPEEDHILADAHAELGDQWDEISKKLERWDAASVHSRWCIIGVKLGLKMKRKVWTPEETHILAKAHAELGDQ